MKFDTETFADLTPGQYKSVYIRPSGSTTPTEPTPDPVEPVPDPVEPTPNPVKTKPLPITQQSGGGAISIWLYLVILYGFYLNIRYGKQGTR